MAFWSKLFKKEEVEQPKENRVEIKLCDYCNEMLYEGDEINTFADKKMHRDCMKLLRKEAKKHILGGSQ